MTKALGMLAIKCWYAYPCSPTRTTGFVGYVVEYPAPIIEVVTP